MTRIYLVMATLDAAALLASFLLGFDQMGRAASPSDQSAVYVSWHFIVGLFTAVFTLLVHCLIFTYFLGTGRWTKEVCRAYSIPDHEGPKQTREFKRTAFPPSLFGMLAVIATAGTGGPAQTDPNSLLGMAHPVLAVLTLVINAWAFVVVYRTVALNAAVIDQVMAKVEQMRSAADSPA
jgi:hypothetical protein